MITSWDIYWITRLDGAFIFFRFISVALLVILVLWGWWATIVTQEPFFRKNQKAGKIAIIVVIIISSLLCALMPTTKEFAAIYLIPKIANNEQVQKIPDNVAKLLNAKLEQWLDDLKEKKK